jgi:hypothetical protein
MIARAAVSGVGLLALAGQSAPPSRGPFRGLRVAVYEAHYPDGTLTAGPCHPRRPWSGARVSLHRPSRRRYMDRREMRTSALLPKLRVAPAAQLSGAAGSRSSAASASMILIVTPMSQPSASAAHQRPIARGPGRRGRREDLWGQRTRHNCTVLSGLPAASSRPSGLKATVWTAPPWPARVVARAGRALSETSHKITVW